MVVVRHSVDAVGCAVGMQQGVERHNRREPRAAGGAGRAHAGEPICEEDDYFGTPVVEAPAPVDRAEGGQILASDVVRVLVGGPRRRRFAPVGDSR